MRTQISSDFASFVALKEGSFQIKNQDGTVDKFNALGGVLTSIGQHDHTDEATKTTVSYIDYTFQDGAEKCQLSLSRLSNNCLGLALCLDNIKSGFGEMFVILKASRSKDGAHTNLWVKAVPVSQIPEGASPETINALATDVKWSRQWSEIPQISYMEVAGQKYPTPDSIKKRDEYVSTLIAGLVARMPAAVAPAAQAPSPVAPIDMPDFEQAGGPAYAAPAFGGGMPDFLND